MNTIFFRKVLYVLACGVIILSSCEKKDAGSEKGSDEVTKSEHSADTEKNNTPPSSFTTGIIYVHKAALYTENSDGKMKWAAEASLGDTAVYLGEKKEAQRTDGQKRTFFHIEVKGTNYWIQDYCYEPNTVPAFVKMQDTVLYKSDSLTAATDEIVPQFFFIAVYKDSMPTGNEKFVKIATYCPELAVSWIIKDKYVKRECLDFAEANVQAMLLAQVAMESRNDTIRAELFQNAIEMDSDYKDDIAELQNLTEIIINEEEFLKTVLSEKIEEQVIVKNDVNLLSIPVLGNSRLLNTLKANTSAVAYKKVSMTDAENNTVEWYYIQNKQKKGWVQSSDLKDK